MGELSNWPNIGKTVEEHSLSEGYVYQMDAQHKKDVIEVKNNVSSFCEPVSKNRKGEYKYPKQKCIYVKYKMY